MQPIDWTRLDAERFDLLDGVDDQELAQRIESWQRRLLRKDRLAEKEVDAELLALLQQIQHAL